MKAPELKIEEAIAEVVKTREGRFFVDAILRASGFEASAFAPESRKTDYLLGRQSIGIELATVMKEHDLYLDFLKQLKEDKQNG